MKWLFKEALLAEFRNEETTILYWLGDKHAVISFVKRNDCEPSVDYRAYLLQEGFHPISEAEALAKLL